MQKERNKSPKNYILNSPLCPNSNDARQQPALKTNGKESFESIMHCLASLLEPVWLSNMSGGA